MSRRFSACCRVFATSSETCFSSFSNTNLYIAAAYSLLNKPLPPFFVRFEALVSPSTMRRTQGPKRTSMSLKEISGLSSTVSCSKPAVINSACTLSEARRTATATGCMMYGSPDFLFWPLWANTATHRPESILTRSGRGRYMSAGSSSNHIRSASLMSSPSGSSSWAGVPLEASSQRDTPPLTGKPWRATLDALWRWPALRRSLS
mmetsp:Transcript_16744/g.26756  ORF Transcript_16744/g.26756 Transcript_16744/m.26756 type:complete len:205 (+) Transcript_16744:1436-2050(+)